MLNPVSAFSSSCLPGEPRAQRVVEIHGFLEPALLRKVVHQPEAAQQEGAFVAGDPVGRLGRITTIVQELENATIKIAQLVEEEARQAEIEHQR